MFERSTRRRLPLVALTAFVCATLINASTPLSALATTHSPPWADAFSSHYPGTGGLDTTGSGAKMKSRMATAGYTSFNTINTSSASAIGAGNAQDDAVWAMFGHAGAGGISTYYPSIGNWTWLFANSAVGSCASPNACLQTVGFTKLHKIRLALFAGCETADTSHGVDLLTMAYSTVGMDSAVGFSDLIYWPMADQWTDSFFFWLYFSSKNVHDAAWNATQDVITVYGSAYGFDHLVIKGGSVKIQPPAYGS